MLPEHQIIHTDEHLGDRKNDSDNETILILGHWQYVSRGHSPGETIYPRTVAHDIAESRHIAARPPTTSS